jgi:fluoride exporter
MADATAKTAQEADAKAGRLPIDPDVDLHVPEQRDELRRGHGDVLAAISLGGGVGALARYGIGYAFPAAPRGFPWATFGINVTGCLLIGVLMVLVTDVWGGQRLIRPFVGAGVLGGFTTFSTYVVDIQRLVDNGAAGVALGYLAATVLAALAAVYAGITLTRLAVRTRRAREQR